MKVIQTSTLISSLAIIISSTGFILTSSAQDLDNGCSKKVEISIPLTEQILLGPTAVRFKDVKVEFAPNKKVDPVDEKGFDYALNLKKLAQGELQLYKEMFSKEKFAKNVPGLKELDDKIFKVLPANKGHSHVSVSKQAYILKNVSLDQLTYQLYRDPNFIDKAYHGMRFIFPENIGKTEDDFSWIVVQPIKTKETVAAMAKHSKYFPFSQDADKKPSQELLESILKLDPSLGVPDKIAITTISGPRIHDKKNKDGTELGKDAHPDFKGSNSITLYYKINESKDLLVVTYQMAGIAVPTGLGWLVKLGHNLFDGNVANTIKGSRGYFAKTNDDQEKELSTSRAPSTED